LPDKNDPSQTFISAPDEMIWLHRLHWL